MIEEWKNMKLDIVWKSVLTYKYKCNITVQERGYYTEYIREYKSYFYLQIFSIIILLQKCVFFWQKNKLLQTVLTIIQYVE